MAPVGGDHRMSRILTLLLGATLVLAAGCSTGSTTQNTGMGTGGLTGVDAGPDAGPDAGSADAGFIDAGSIDAGSIDAGSMDGGTCGTGSACNTVTQAGQPVSVVDEVSDGPVPVGGTFVPGTYALTAVVIFTGWCREHADRPDESRLRRSRERRHHVHPRRTGVGAGADSTRRRADLSRHRRWVRSSRPAPLPDVYPHLLFDRPGIVQPLHWNRDRVRGGRGDLHATVGARSRSLTREP